MNVGFDYVPCKISGKNALGMIDTGANISVVSHNFVKKNNLKMQDTTKSIKLANG